MKTDINGEQYTPILVEAHSDAANKRVVVSGGESVRNGDILISNPSTQFYVAHTEFVEDLFEEFWILTLNFVAMGDALMWHPADYLQPGTELKILSSTFAER